jgi:hypothetical protein
MPPAAPPASRRPPGHGLHLVDRRPRPTATRCARRWPPPSAWCRRHASRTRCTTRRRLLAHRHAVDGALDQPGRLRRQLRRRPAGGRRAMVLAAAPVLLVACDVPYPEPLHARAAAARRAPRWRMVLEPAGPAGPHARPGPPTPSATRCSRRRAGDAARQIPAAACLPLLQALAGPVGCGAGDRRPAAAGARGEVEARHEHLPANPAIRDRRADPAPGPHVPARRGARVRRREAHHLPRPQPPPPTIRCELDGAAWRR